MVKVSRVTAGRGQLENLTPAALLHQDQDPRGSLMGALPLNQCGRRFRTASIIWANSDRNSAAAP